VDRAPGPSVRLRLTLSYAGFLLVAGALLLAVAWLFLLRYVPDGVLVSSDRPGGSPGLFVPNRSDLQRAFVPRAAAALAFLLVFGLLGGWFLAAGCWPR
jgi:two-component system, OmpR family, sensor histidine kinase VanS